VTARMILYGVLQHSGAELSAHQMIEAEQEPWSSSPQIGAEYDTVGAVAQRDRWIGLLEKCGLSDVQTESLLSSDSFGPRTAELRRAEANHYEPLRRGGAAAQVGSAPIARRCAGHRSRVDQSLQHETSRPKRGKRQAEANLSPA
jgi:hypothetical protein